MGQALQTRLHTALAPLSELSVRHVHQFSVQCFKDLDMECSLCLEDVVDLTDNIPGIEPEDLFNLFIEESIADDEEISALDLLTAMVVCANGTPMNTARVLFHLYDFDNTGGVRGDQINNLVETVFRTLCIVLGGDNLPEPTSETIKSTLEGVWSVYEEDVVSAEQFRSIITPILSASRSDAPGNKNLKYEDVCPRLYRSFELQFEDPIPGIEDPAVVAARIAEAERLKKKKDEEEAEKLAEAERLRKKKEEEEAARVAEAAAARKAKQAAMQYMQKVDRIRISNPGNLVAKFLTQELFDLFQSIEDRAKLQKCVMAGIDKDPTLAVGCFALRPSDYEDFSLFFDNIILQLNESSTNSIQEDPNWGNVDELDMSSGNIDFDNVEVILRVEVDRNVTGFNFACGMDKTERLELEDTVLKALSVAGFTSDNGTLYSLSPGKEHFVESEDEQNTLVSKGILMDRSGVRVGQNESINTALDAGGAFEHWPHGRGSYAGNDGIVTIQYGGENHIRIICETNSSLSNQKEGRQIGAVYRKLKATLEQIEDAIQKVLNEKSMSIDGGPFVRNERYGYLTTSPTNLGTAMKTSALIGYIGTLTDGNEIVASVLESGLEDGIALGMRQVFRGIGITDTVEVTSDVANNAGKLLIELRNLSSMYVTEDYLVKCMCDGVRSVGSAISKKSKIEVKEEEEVEKAIEGEADVTEEKEGREEEGENMEMVKMQKQNNTAELDRDKEQVEVQDKVVEEDTQVEAQEEAQEEFPEDSKGGDMDDAKVEAEEDIKEETKEEAAQEEIKEEAKEEAKEDIKEEAKEEAKEDIKEEAKEEAKEDIKEEANDQAQEDIKEEAKEVAAQEDIKEEAKEEAAQEDIKDEAQEDTKEEAKGEARDDPKENVQEGVQDGVEEKAQEDNQEEPVQEDAQEVIQNKVQDEVQGVQETESSNELTEKEKKMQDSKPRKSKKRVSKRNQKYINVYNGLIEKAGRGGKLTFDVCREYIVHMSKKEKPIHGIRFIPDDILQKIVFSNKDDISREEFVLCFMEIKKEKSVIKDAYKTFDSLNKQSDFVVPTDEIIRSWCSVKDISEVDKEKKSTMLQSLKEFDSGSKGGLIFEEYYAFCKAEREKDGITTSLMGGHVDLSKDIGFAPEYEGYGNIK